jgi:hypothetical protein
MSRVSRAGSCPVKPAASVRAMVSATALAEDRLLVFEFQRVAFQRMEESLCSIASSIHVVFPSAYVE